MIRAFAFLFAAVMVLAGAGQAQAQERATCATSWAAAPIFRGGGRRIEPDPAHAP